MTGYKTYLFALMTLVTGILQQGGSIQVPTDKTGIVLMSLAVVVAILRKVTKTESPI